MQEVPALHDMVQGQGWPLEQVEQDSLHTVLVIVVTFQGRLGRHQPRQDDRRPPAHLQALDLPRLYLPVLDLPGLYLPILELLFLAYGRKDLVGSQKSFVEMMPSV